MLGLKCFLFGRRLYALGKTVLILKSDLSSKQLKDITHRHRTLENTTNVHLSFSHLIGQSFSGSQIESSNIPTVFGSVIGVRGVMFRQTEANIHDTSRPPRMQSLLNTLIFEGSKWMLIPTRMTLRDLFENTWSYKTASGEFRRFQLSIILISPKIPDEKYKLREMKQC